MPPKVGSPVDRFWRQVARGGPDDCWQWLGAPRGKGYGAFSVKVGDEARQRKQIDAHRFSYELHVAPIPPGMLVCHHCDNPPCVNPAHLFVGTYADNNRDKSMKGRNPGNRTSVGRQPYALRGDELEVARAMLAAGATQRAIATRFGISPAAVCRSLRYHGRVPS